MAESKRFLFTMWDGGGNVPPLLGVARRLIARGHAVRVLADPTIEPEARAAGCEFSSWTTAPFRTTRDRSADLLKDYEAKSPLASFEKYVREFLGGPAPRWAADTLAELEARPVDVFVAEQLLPATMIAAEKLGIRTVALSPNIWMLPTPGIPPLGPGFAPARGIFGRVRDAAFRAMSNRLFNKALPSLNGVRTSYGLAPVTSTMEQIQRPERTYVLSSPVFDFTSPAMPSNVLYAGPILDDPTWSEPWRSPWAADDARPLVIVGLSTTFQDQVSTLRRVVEALSSLPVRALVTLGEALSPSEIEGTDNVVVVPSAPHSQIMPQAAVLVTHCGHGTTMKGLAAGVPLVCMPMGRDQNDTAARVVDRGAGVRLEPTASMAAIRAAVQAVLTEPRFREGAARIARAVASHEGCVDIATSLEEFASAPQNAAGAARMPDRQPQEAGAAPRPVEAAIS